MSGAEPLLIASAVGSAAQGFVSYQQGVAQAKAAKSTAAYNAEVEKQRYATEAEQLRRDQRLALSKQRLAAAGSGAQISSFDDAFESSVTQSLLDQALLDYNYKQKQQQIAFGGKVEAKQAKSAATSGLISGLSGAASKAYGGYSPQKEVIYWNS